MNKVTFLKNIISEFDQWYLTDLHSQNENFYKTLIEKNRLKSLNKEQFIRFFYEFVSEGGKVQSGGYRTKDKFKETIDAKYEGFNAFILKPFEINFDLKKWFNQINEFVGFGVGIATIYLNRIDSNKYSIMNNKTIDALNKLGYNISSTKNFRNYELVKKYQDELINKFPELLNYYKADAFNHFLVAVYRGQLMATDLGQFESLENTIEQNLIENYVKLDTTTLDKSELLKKIKECETDKSEIVRINGKSFRRRNYLMVQIKKYRDYKCQFCSTKIQKSNGEYYIEACHIDPKAKGGADSLDNILVLCPNCHKLFDYGKKTHDKKENNQYSVVLNGKHFQVSLI